MVHGLFSNSSNELLECRVVDHWLVTSTKKRKPFLYLDPVVEEKLNARRKTIKNEKIDMYNYAAEVSLWVPPR